MIILTHSILRCQLRNFENQCFPLFCKGINQGLVSFKNYLIFSNIYVLCTEKPSKREGLLENVKNKIDGIVNTYSEPSRKELLPDPLLPPYRQPKYTLVIEPKGVLYCPEWDMQHGWRFKKRPGVDDFMKIVDSSNYEIIFFTEMSGDVAFPLNKTLDANNNAFYYLFKDSTHFINNHHVKNLNYLNRDLSKVVAVDVEVTSLQFHPNNSLILAPWSGRLDDFILPQLASFLQVLSWYDVDDVRPVLEHYRNFPDPLQKFQENRLEVLRMQEEVEKEWKKETPKNVDVEKWKRMRFYYG